MWTLGSSPGLSSRWASAGVRVVGVVGVEFSPSPPEYVYVDLSIWMFGRWGGDLRVLRGEATRSCARRALCAKPASIPATTASLTFF